MSNDKAVIILGSGPGIGVGVASHFASQPSFARIALLSRNTERLEQDKKTVLEASNRSKSELTVKTYAVDLANIAQLKETLAKVENDLGPPKVVIYNASRLRQTVLCLFSPRSPPAHPLIPRSSLQAAHSTGIRTQFTLRWQCVKRHK